MLPGSMTTGARGEPVAAHPGTHFEGSEASSDRHAGSVDAAVMEALASARDITQPAGARSMATPSAPTRSSRFKEATAVPLGERTGPYLAQRHPSLWYLAMSDPSDTMKGLGGRRRHGGIEQTGTLPAPKDYGQIGRVAGPCSGGEWESDNRRTSTATPPGLTCCARRTKRPHGPASHQRLLLKRPVSIIHVRANSLVDSGRFDGGRTGRS